MRPARSILTLRTGTLAYTRSRACLDSTASLCVFDTRSEGCDVTNGIQTAPQRLHFIQRKTRDEVYKVWVDHSAERNWWRPGVASGAPSGAESTSDHSLCSDFSSYATTFDMHGVNFGAPGGGCLHCIHTERRALTPCGREHSLDAHARRWGHRSVLGYEHVISIRW